MFKKVLSIKIFIIFFLAIFSYANEKVTLQLKWFHQFQFAGYYAAKEKGFYADVGLDVEIKQRDIKYNNIEQVIIGEADYGIADSVLMLYKAKEHPVVVVAPIFQHSPGVLISLKNSDTSSPYDLDGKDVLFYPSDTDGFAILAMLKKLDKIPNLIRKREKNDYTKLINKEVDAIPAYLSNEPFYFKQRGIDINVINPSSYGFDLYGDILFTNVNESINHPERVLKFKEASLKGWEYALDHKEEIIQLIHEKYNKEKSIEHLRYEADAIEKLILKELTPLGTIDQGRIQYIFDLYKEYGLIEKGFENKEFIFEDYIKNYSNLNLSEVQREYLDSIDTIKVQTFKSFPPFSYDSEGIPRGYSIDYIKLLGDVLGKNIEFVSDVTWKESLDMIKKGELDLLPSLAKNSEREKFINYTDIEHIVYQVALGVKVGSGIKSMEDLKGKTISVLDKSFLHTILKEKYPEQKLYLAPTIKDAVEAVASGKSDAILDNLASIEYYKKQNWLSNIETIKIKENKNIPSDAILYMGVAKNNELLKGILQKANNTLPYNEILNLKEKWLNTKEKVKFSDNEHKYLKEKKVLNMCIDPAWLPFEMIQDGKHIGMTSEYIKLFQENLPIPIKLTITEDWTQTVSFAKERKCDFVTIMMENEDRKKYMNFTENLMEMPLVIVTKQDKPFINQLNDVIDEKFAMVKGYAYLDTIKEKYPKLRIMEVKSPYEGLKKVDQGEIYGFIGTLPVISYNIQKSFGNNLKIDGKLESVVGFPMAIRNDEELLGDIFNKLINSISIEKRSEILNRWVTIEYEEKVDYKTALFIGVVAVLIILIIVLKNRAISNINTKLSLYIDVVDKHVLTSETDLKGKIISASQAFCEISGFTKEELVGNRHSIVRHPDTPKELFEELWSTITSGKVWKGELKNKRKDGSYYWVEATISPKKDSSGKSIGYTAIRHDITDKKRIEELSITDELTTLYNKRYFNEVFIRELNKAKRLNQPFGFIILDVDNFKKYNDHYGHQKGDEVLRAVGATLKEICQRATDIPFRIGGEEFGIVFIPKSKEEACRFAELVNNHLEELHIEHELNDASEYITASIGLYMATGPSLDSDKDIYNFADEALYQAKTNGRNQYKIYEA